MAGVSSPMRENASVCIRAPILALVRSAAYSAEKMRQMTPEMLRIIGGAMTTQITSHDSASKILIFLEKMVPTLGIEPRTY